MNHTPIGLWVKFPPSQIGLQHKTPFSTRFLKPLWGYWKRAQERCLLRLKIEFNWIYHRSYRNIQERYGRLDHNGPHVRQNYYQRWDISTLTFWSVWIHWLKVSLDGEAKLRVRPQYWSDLWAGGLHSTRPHSGKQLSIIFHPRQSNGCWVVFRHL